MWSARAMRTTTTMVVLVFIIIAIFITAIDAESFTIEEATIDEIQKAFSENKLTSRQLVDFYLRQIETLNPVLLAVIEVNPDAEEQADEADREREGSIDRSVFGKLHGIPVLIKDTIATRDKMNTTAGSFVLLGSVVPRDATVVERLRSAGGVILGKASLSEWYHFRSFGCPNGWCARAGQGVAILVYARIKHNTSTKG